MTTKTINIGVCAHPVELEVVYSILGTSYGAEKDGVYYIDLLGTSNNIIVSVANVTTETINITDITLTDPITGCNIFLDGLGSMPQSIPQSQTMAFNIASDSNVTGYSCSVVLTITYDSFESPPLPIEFKINFEITH